MSRGYSWGLGDVSQGLGRRYLHALAQYETTSLGRVCPTLAQTRLPSVAANSRSLLPALRLDFT